MFEHMKKQRDGHYFEIPTDFLSEIRAKICLQDLLKIISLKMDVI